MTAAKSPVDNIVLFQYSLIYLNIIKQVLLSDAYNATCLHGHIYKISNSDIKSRFKIVLLNLPPSLYIGIFRNTIDGVSISLLFLTL